LGHRYRYRARKQAVDLLDGRLLTRAVAVPKLLSLPKSLREMRLLHRLATNKMRFPRKDRMMTRTKDQTPGYLRPDHDLSMTSR